jgi:NCAIR mutase (PurE)-related protein
MDSFRELLRAYRRGDADEDDVVDAFQEERAFEKHLLGRFDHNRESRTGLPEVILAEGKRPDSVADIFETYLDRSDDLFATRVTDEILEGVSHLREDLHWFDEAGILSTYPPDALDDSDRPSTLVVSAGSLDRPVALEAATSNRLFGSPTETLFDVGVAGLSRLAADLDTLDDADILIVVAGMDGALPSVIGGLAEQPLIAVPTSVGYGANFDGVAPMLTMLNACSPGTTIVNIDNGFGAAAAATKMAMMAVNA